MEVLKSLIQKAKEEGKPIEKDILKLKDKHRFLTDLAWIKIKHQVWARAQKHISKKKKIVENLLDN